jgi:hypothetical protein
VRISNRLILSSGRPTSRTPHFRYQPNLTAGILNDFTAIATYAPYVDAMFVDRQCASLLQQGRVRTELSYKARIFSMSHQQEFLDYLKGLGDSALKDVRELAHELYGVED